MGVRVFPADEVFKLRDTYGIPFDVVFGGLHAQRAIVDWRSLVEVCVEHGWNRKTATAQIVDAVRDVYPQDRVEFIKWADGPGSYKEV
jgi:alanyl-tRNA synthetase